MITRKIEYYNIHTGESFSAKQKFCSEVCAQKQEAYLKPLLNARENTHFDYTLSEGCNKNGSCAYNGDRDYSNVHPLTPKGEHFLCNNSTDMENWLLYAAVVAYEQASHKKIPNIPEEGLRVSMQVNGVEVSPRHFIKRIQTHFDQRTKDYDKELRKEAATLIKGRISRLNDVLSAFEKQIQQELIVDFPELSEEIFGD